MGFSKKPTQNMSGWVGNSSDWYWYRGIHITDKFDRFANSFKSSNRYFTASFVVVLLIYFRVDLWQSENENKSISNGTWWKRLTGAIFQINLKLNSIQTRVIHVKAPVNLMLCVKHVISNTTELNLVHLIFLKTRKSRAFLKNIYMTKRTRQIFR